MNKVDLRDSVQFLFDDTKEKSISVYAFLGGVYYKLDLLPDSRDDFKCLFINGVKKQIVDNDRYEVRPYSTSDERKNCYYEYDLSEEPFEILTMRSVVGVQDVEPYRVDDMSTLKDIEALYIVLSHQMESVVLYKNISQLDFVDVHQRFLLVKNSDHQLSRLDKDYLRISSSFQMIRVSDGTVILDISPLERSQGFDQIVKNEVTARIDDIDQMGLIEDITSFKSLVDGLPTRKALLQLKNSQVIKKEIDAKTVLDFYEKKRELIGIIDYNDDKSKLAPNKKEQVKRLLKLLNDDYLTSELTESEYDSVAKDELKKNN